MPPTTPSSSPSRSPITAAPGVEVRSALFGARTLGLGPPVAGRLQAVFVAQPVAIEAPIEQVWAVLRDFASYPEWNPLNRAIRPASDLRVGDRISLDISWGPYERGGAPVDPTTLATDLKNTETFSIDQPGEALGWCDTIGPLHHAERVQYLTRLSAGRTLYRTEEIMVGLLSPLIGRLFRDKIDRGFTACGAALKRRVESLHPPA